MNFFGLGFAEIVLILLIVLVVVGPERLPSLARQTGLFIARVQSWIQRSPDAMMILQARKELEREIENLRLEMVQMQQAQKKLVESAKQMVQQPLDELKSIGEELKSVPTTASDSGGVKPLQDLTPLDESPFDEPELVPNAAPNASDALPSVTEPSLTESNGYLLDESTPQVAAEPSLDVPIEDLEPLPETALNWDELEASPPLTSDPLLQALEDTTRQAHEATLTARVDELALRLQTLVADLTELRADLAVDSLHQPEVPKVAERLDDDVPIAPPNMV